MLWLIIITQSHCITLVSIFSDNHFTKKKIGRTELLKGNSEKSLKFLKQCNTLYQAAISLSKPTDHLLFQRYFSWSTALKQLGSLHSSNLTQSQHFFSLSQEKIEKSISLQPQSYEAIDNYGLLLANWGQILGFYKKNDDAEQKFVKAQLCFDQAKKLSPSKVEAFINSGLAFQYWASVLKKKFFLLFLLKIDYDRYFEKERIV